MIRHTLKIILAERRINIWILLELIVAFTVLWYCSDYLIYMGKQYIEPKGFDVANTYLIDIGITDEGRSHYYDEDEVLIESMNNTIWNIFERIKNYPAIEYASMSLNSHPYSGSYSGGVVKVDTVMEQIQIKDVTPDFFNVFKIKLLEGRTFTEDDYNYKNQVVISGDRNNKFAGKDITLVKELITFYWEDDEDEPRMYVTGVVEKTKSIEYIDYTPAIYHLLNKQNDITPVFREICVRVRPEADKNFIENFTEDMESQIESVPYYLASVYPVIERRKDFMDEEEWAGNFKNIYSVSTFLIINIFLGVVGTFWIRTKSRKNEIGLRMALGAPRKSVRSMFIKESLLLLFIASLIAVFICVNFSFLGILEDSGINIAGETLRQMQMADKGAGIGIWQYFINYAVVFICLAAITIISVWYPARKASNIPTTDVLREE